MSKIPASKNKRSITAKFITEKGRWDKQSNSFVDRSSVETISPIEMELFERDGKQILKFIGGPTGFESYYVEDLNANPMVAGIFCICGGTINRWPRCEVPFADVADFLNDMGTNTSCRRQPGVPKNSAGQGEDHA